MSNDAQPDVFVPIPTSPDERRRALAGDWVHPEGRLVLRVKRDQLAALWQGEGLPPFVVGAADTEARLYRFLYAFEPAEVEDESLAIWHRVLGMPDEELRRQDFALLYRAAFTCAQGDRVVEGIVLQHEDGMVRVCNELRRRMLS